MYLTAAGYWPAVPNVKFNQRIYEAIIQYQAAKGFPQTGYFSPAEEVSLREEGKPLLSRWNLQPVRHPVSGIGVWVPTGVGLSSKRTPNRSTI